MTANKRGFTLLEMLLVLVIVSMMVLVGVNYYQQQFLATRLDRTAAQMQQILNAGLAFYVSNGYWPNNIACLQGLGGSDPACGSTTVYLPEVLMSPWGQPYTVTSDPNKSGNFYTYTPIVTDNSMTARSYAAIVAGKLPLAFTTGSVSATPPTTSSCSQTTCYVVSSVNVPGQNLNNATAVNFANLYHQGACIPVPSCPVDKNGTTMIPQVMVVPVSVSGLNDADPSNTNNTLTNVYPISSFTASAVGDGTQINPPACTGSTGAPDCSSAAGGIPPAKAYWRACLQVITERGNVEQTNPSKDGGSWGQYVTMMAITRCGIQGEPTGSNFTVYSN